ncbi:MAG TPA: ADOP family duplicated permease, partial [Vicinamibacterales bacterium]|nr:ADOP family duplicated permease [Vicinamibacterales bacterium]
VLFKPLPYPSPERIVKIESAPLAFTKTGFTAPRTMEESPVFAGSGIYVAGGINVGGEPHAERVRAAAVSAGFFAAMGTQTILGRPFTRDESRADATVAVISEGLWRRRMGASRSLDAPLVLNGRPYTVIGVMPAGFAFPLDAEVWVAPGADQQIAGGAIAPDTVARMATGVTLEQARQETYRLKYEPGETPHPMARPIVVTPLRDELVGSVRPLFGIMAVAVSLVLLVACMNVANLLLARVSARDREMSIRRALGASRWRLMRYLLAESALIAVCAGLVAIPIAMSTLQGMRLLLPPQLHNATSIGIDARAAVVTGLLCLSATILFGLVPSMSLQARGASDLLRTGTATSSPFWRRFRGGLVAAQLAAALILLAGSITIVKTVSSLLQVDLGASGDRVLTLQLTVPRVRYATPEQHAALREQLDARLRAIPGVEAVGASTLMPGTQVIASGFRLNIEGLLPPKGGDATIVYAQASEEYFDALGIPLVAGRLFEPADSAGATRVAIVSEDAARLHGLEPAQLIGRRHNVNFGEPKIMAEIVGVVRNVRLRGPESGFATMIYVPLSQAARANTLYVVVRTSGDPRLAIAAARDAVRAVDPDMPPYNLRTFDEIRASYLAGRRFAIVVMLAFAGLTGILAAIGLYGVMSYLVQLRVREIGIRVALGATPGGVLRETMRGGLSYALPGIVIGAGLATILLRVFISRVPGLQQADLATLVFSAAGMLALAVIATWIPAHRAGRIDPVVALKGE